jgi:hypothetical protein
MSRNMSRKLMLAIGLFAVATTSAFAQYYPGHRGTREEQAACRRDALHLCRGMSDDSQIQNCLVAQKHRLSGGCRRALQRHGY